MLKRSAAEADGTVVAGDDGTDLTELGIQLVQLKRREQEVARHLQLARHRADAFPSDARTREVSTLADTHEQLLTRIDELEVLLAPLRRVRGA